jgi:NADP-dependent 3-hydroxy acid dehydrogenase YdfG
MHAKSIIITGANSGVGKATAYYLATRGVKVFLIARRSGPLDEVVVAIQRAGGIAFAYAADLSDYTQVQSAFVSADERLGCLDALVNCAAVPANNIFNTSVGEWPGVIAANLTASMYCCKEAVERMRLGGRGQIINIGSLCIRVLDNGCDLYVATKSGIAGFTASLRKEIAGDNIVVTLINPGQIASGMVSESKIQKEAAVEQFTMLMPEDVAEAIVYCLGQPERVAITELELRPRKQMGL